MESKEKIEVARSLAFALSQVRSKTEQRLAVYEFWHSLNRKGLVENSEVDRYVQETLKNLEGE